MNLTLLAATIPLLLCATQGLAQEGKFASYTIKAKTEVVEGAMVVDGYSPAEVQKFVAQDCASGKAGALELLGKPQKKRGALVQKFRTSCKGGPNPRIGTTTLAAVEVERLGGRDVAEYTYATDSGELGYAKVNR